MIDYYALPDDFPEYNEKPSGSCFQRVEFMELKFYENINLSKFLPYLQLHEFEALVFACEKYLPEAFVNADRKILKVNAINNSFNSHEEINDDPSTAPSKRLLNIFPDYQKPLHSQLVISKSNIDEIRLKCSHFNSWINRLES